MNSGSTLLGKQPCKAEHAAQSTVPRISIGYDRSQVIDPRCVGSLIGRHVASFVPMLTVVMQLCFEKTLYLVWHGRVRIVS